MFMDAHCHLSLYEGDPQAKVAELKAAKIHGLCFGGYDADEWQRQDHLIQRLGDDFRMVSAYGLHPWAIEHYSDEMWQQALNQLAKKLPDAELCGELGLDYAIVRDEQARLRQKARFEQQLSLCEPFAKPLVIHCVRAHHHLLPCLKEPSRRPSSGMIHSFIGSEQIAKQYLDLGFYLSFSPASLSSDRKALLKFIPKDRLLLESDAPHHKTHVLYPQQQPAYPDSRCILQLAEVVADAWQTSSGTEVLQQCYENLKNLIPTL